MSLPKYPIALPTSNSPQKWEDLPFAMRRECNGLNIVIIIGDTSVGKSSIVAKYVDDYFHRDHLATIGVDFKVK